MRQPAIGKLLKNSDSKYALVVAAAKRARLITDGADILLDKEDIETSKPVSMALEEIAAGKIKFESTKAGIK